MPFKLNLINYQKNNDLFSTTPTIYLQSLYITPVVALLGLSIGGEKGFASSLLLVLFLLLCSS